MRIVISAVQIWIFTAFSEVPMKVLMWSNCLISLAPGPIYTPLIPATFDESKVENAGSDTPLGRRGQPSENAPAYVYLASQDSTYVTGQVIHVNGGDFMTT